MFTSQVFSEELFLSRKGSGHAPEIRDPRVVHPFVQKLDVGHCGCVFGFEGWRGGCEVCDGGDGDVCWKGGERGSGVVFGGVEVGCWPVVGYRSGG